ncbi:Kinesin-like protein KIN-7F [Sesamum angolense]|uniref:Kinesin-like protein KIN-7F n=1 Tax=Sesamum angolense TaxID=2727404 RepID=A0AAE2C786_9LAMI|nr:Kinesin-like protein KIN-7F [Sesamum angolense]
MELASNPAVKDLGFTLSPKDDNEGREDTASGVVTSKEVEELISASIIADNESISTILKEEKDFSSIRYLDIASPENISMTHHLAKDSFGSRSLNFDRSRSCKASNVTISASPWLKMMEYSGNTSSFGSERESEAGGGGKIYTLNFSTCVKNLSRTDFQFPGEDAPDIEIDTPGVKISTVEDGGGSSSDLIEKAELATEQETTIKSLVKTSMVINLLIGTREVAGKGMEKDVKDIGLNPIEDGYKGRSFRCYISGDRDEEDKILEGKILSGEKANVNGKRLTLSSRQQLANLIWSKTEDINHIADSAVLVAKLVGFIEPGQAPKKEMFGLNFAPKGSTGVCSFKRSLEFLLPGNTLGTAEGFSASEAGFCSLAFVSVSDFHLVSLLQLWSLSQFLFCLLSASEAVFLVSGVSASPSPAFFCDASASTFWLAGFTPTSSEVLVSRPPVAGAFSISSFTGASATRSGEVTFSLSRGSHHSDEPQNLRFLLLDYGNTIRNSSIITAMITDAAAFAAPLLQYHHLTFLDLKVQNLPWTTSVLKTEFIPMGS